MSAPELVRRHWFAQAAQHACAGEAAQKMLDELVAAYGEPHRAYHTLDHIAALLGLLDEHGEGVTDRAALVLAILFHDVVYDPARRDNEAASAGFASGRLAALGFPEEMVSKVARLIHATRHGAQVGDEADSDLALLLDLDLSVLAAPAFAYDAYAQAIRYEFSLYPNEVYRPGRRRVLEEFLMRERIYSTEHLRALWEGRARANIAREIAELA